MNIVVKKPFRNPMGNFINRYTIGLHTNSIIRNSRTRIRIGLDAKAIAIWLIYITNPPDISDKGINTTKIPMNIHTNLWGSLEDLE